MLLGKFLGNQINNKNKVYIVVDCEKKSEAIKIANRLFKIKKDNLGIKRVYMDNPNANEFSFKAEEGKFKAWAVYRK